jgi:hypothetical protein
MNVKDKTYYCKKCAAAISWMTALYRSGNCVSCSHKGKIHSEEAKKRMSNARKGENHHYFGKHLSKEHREKLSKANVGKHPSEETRKKLSKSKRGKNHPFFGKHLSETHREFISNSNKGKTPSLETKIKISKSLKGKFIGKNSPNWQGGLSFFPYSLKFNGDLKRSIRERDNFTCQECGVEENKNQKKLSIHHIDYDKENCSESNLISLCKPCHSKTNGNRDYWFAYFTYIMENK